jgi:Major Facilitator Superfamily
LILPETTIMSQTSDDDKHTKPTTNSVSDWLVLPTIVFSQFAGASLWFAPNAVVSQVDNFGESQVAVLVSCVQVGFIAGTLFLTYFALTDRLSPPWLFTGACLAGATFNIICVAARNFPAWAILRLLVGVCLAGVYPVGMKIAAMEYPSGLGARLGVLVGALTLGTAFPWLVRGLSDQAGLPFEVTLWVVTALAAVGAILMALVMVPRGGGLGSATLRNLFFCCFAKPEPKDQTASWAEQVAKDNVSDHKQSSTVFVKVDSVEVLATKDASEQNGEAEKTKISTSSNGDANLTLSGISALKAILGSSGFRAAAIGYFGHMWELYAFWAHMPSLVNSHSQAHGGVVLGNEALTSFAVIAVGAISCSVGGVWSLRAGRGVFPGSAVVATTSLIVSGCCCLLVPLYQRMSEEIFLLFLLIWGSAVVADSAQFSSLAAMYAYPGLVGTSLTLNTSVGFAITIVSIQLLGALIDSGWDPGNALALLAIGPAIGIYRSYSEWPLHRLCSATRSNRKSNESMSVEENSQENGLEQA